MKTMGIFLALALSSSPMPSGNYYASISPDIANEITELVVSGEYREYLDFNGDGKLSIADVVGVRKRHLDNCKYGNKLTLDSETVDSIVVENYSESPIYWEIYRVNGQLCRQHELTVSEVSSAEIYLEFEDFSETVKVEINPFTETITVI